MTKTTLLLLATKTDGAFYLSGDNYKFYNVEGSALGGDGFSHHSVWAIKQFQDKLIPRAAYAGRRN